MRGGAFLKWIVALGVLAVAFVALVLMSGRHQPRIQHPDILLAEAIQLSKELPAGPVPKNKWPEEVRALRPKGVFLSLDDLGIWTDGGGIGTSWGYVIYFDASKVKLTDVSGSTTYTPTKHPNIVKYETP